MGDLHPAAGHRAILIGADGDELHIAHQLGGPHQICHENERAFQHAQKQGAAALILLIQRRAQLGDPGFQLLLCHQNLQNILFHFTVHTFSPLSL